ncbi:MAG: 2-hydroxyacyl-CoA dehydratase [Deltaproteobacteria bacterium]|nr:2-hydroxyacyl-CoA dehydratase [Deltaproteobacteria bacterium]
MIGITATVPVEIIYAAGRIPTDLNNTFITGSRPNRLISRAEAAGFSHGICAWIKGIYATVMDRDIRNVIAVTGGDCSNTIALGEVLAGEGINIIPFEYPLHRDRDFLKQQMDGLAQTLSATWTDIAEAKSELDRVRGKLKRLDRLTYLENKITGAENHLFLVGSSDFEGDVAGFEQRLDRFLAEADARAPMQEDIRLGYLGVPPIFSGFYEFIETIGGRVVYNEVQRQFSMPYGHEDILDQYLSYTYPYDAEGRLRDIAEAVKERRLDGLIHYTQTFCYRQIYDIVLRKSLDVPMLTLEGDRPGPIDGRTALRLETFVHMLKERKGVF